MVRFAPPPPRPRWVNRRHIADVLAQLTPSSVTRVRLGLMHWTGMRRERSRDEAERGQERPSAHRGETQKRVNPERASPEIGDVLNRSESAPDGERSRLGTSPQVSSSIPNRNHERDTAPSR